MAGEENFSERESLALITNMIQRAKSDYHDSGTSVLLWGSMVAISSFTSFIQWTFDIDIGFDIWWLVMIAIIPQVFISIKERKQRRFKSHTDIALDAVWLVYAVSVFGVVAYHNIIPGATEAIMRSEGWVIMKHYQDGSRPDEVLRPFAPSIFSIYLLVFAFPTLVTGIVKKFRPMLVGAVITYVLFVCSCFTPSRYDMLFGTVTALVCWFIPGIILRKKYNRQKKGNV